MKIGQGDLKLINPSLADGVANAYRLLRAKQHRLRLDGFEKTRTSLEGDPALTKARLAVSYLWQEIFAAPSV